jgi:Uma2 family endonuclease
MTREAAVAVPLFHARRSAMVMGDEVPMTIQLPPHLDKPAFLAWADGREGRYELVQGRVVMTTGAPLVHAAIVANLAALIHGQLDPEQWTALMGIGVDSGPQTLRSPDIVVDRAGGAGADCVATVPVVLVEVLTRSTVETDLGDKVAAYLALPTLAAYLVFAEGSAKCWAWVRREPGLPSAPNLIVGLDKIIRLKMPSLEFPLAAVYLATDVS